MENVSLYEVTSLYEIVSAKPSIYEVAIRMQRTNEKGYFKKIKEEFKVFKSSNVHLNMGNQEKYFQNLLILFKLWRKEEHYSLNGFNIYEEALVFFYIFIVKSFILFIL